MSTTRVAKRTAYVAIGVAGLALSIAYLVLGAKLPFGTMDQPGAAVFPMFAGVIAVLASLATLHEGWRAERAEHFEFPGGPDAMRVLAVGGLLLGYFLLLPWAGQVITSLLFFIAMLRLLSEYSWARVVAYSAVMSAVLYVAFVRLLQVPLPVGVLDF